MRIGLLARCDDRGLGTMTWEFWRHVEPDRTLVVIEPGAVRQGFRQHVERYPGALVASFDGGQLDEAVWRPFVDGLDVLYSAETFYDWRIVEYARQRGVRTVLHAMPEFWRPDTPQADVLWNPTPWRNDRLQATVVPVPVALDRFEQRQRSAPTFLHLVGHRAAADRAGTTALLRALRSVRRPCRVILQTQDERLPLPRGVRSNVVVELRTRSSNSYWTSYLDASVLVAPRRYGGLSLPNNEAAGAGLGLLLPNVPPNREVWPALYVEADARGSIRTPGGEVITYDTRPSELAAAIDRLAGDEALTADLSAASIAWSQAHSWRELLPTYLVELDRACG